MNLVKGMVLVDSIFTYFEEISKVPRCSGNEKGVSDFLVGFAKKHNLEVIQDDVYNVIIKKPATPGFENAPGVILQGHMDMVCVKTKEKIHDFTKDPIVLKYIDDMVYADGTSLGADNGIAVAIAMAVLTDENARHPALEVIVTVDEESGMTGAKNIDPDNVSGKIMINLDSEEEGKLLVSCAGGLRTAIDVEGKWVNVPSDSFGYTISVNGLLGGHSGIDIDKERGNSNKILGRVLQDIYKEIPFGLAHLTGGSKANVIPSESEAFIFISEADLHIIEKKVEEWNRILKNEYKVSDPNVTVRFEKSTKAFDKISQSTKKVLNLLVAVPNGVQAMSTSIDGLVESSSNIGVLTTTKEGFNFEFSIRSSVGTRKDRIKEQIKAIAKLAGVTFEANGEYPSWEYDPDSKIREICIKVYKEKYGKEPEIVAFHAGVECGLFGEKFPELDMISMGADAFDAHTTNEHVSVSSTKRTYEYLLTILEQLK